LKQNIIALKNSQISKIYILSYNYNSNILHRHKKQVIFTHKTWHTRDTNLATTAIIIPCNKKVIIYIILYIITTDDGEWAENKIT
jgi:hypothetical protein